MKRLTMMAATAALFLASTGLASTGPAEMAACRGKDPCKVCKDCTRCGYCKDGHKCGICLKPKTVRDR